MKTVEEIISVMEDSLTWYINAGFNQEHVLRHNNTSHVHPQYRGQISILLQYLKWIKK